MTARTTRLAGLAAVLALSLTGCGVVAADHPEASPTTSSAAPANPRDALLDGIPDERADAFRYEIKGGESTDPGYAEDLVRASAGLKRTGPGHFAGTTDLTRSTEAEIVDDKTLEALGTRAKAVPFTAVLDAEGRLTTLTVKIPAAGKTKTQTYSVHYSGFGTTPSPAVPAAGDQEKAPADVYDLLRG